MRSPSPLRTPLKILLILHAFLNIAQGMYTLVSPRSYAEQAGPMMSGASDKAIGAVGLGALAVGYYQLIFVYQGNRTLVAATIPLRLGFAGVMLRWGEMGALAYELGVAVLAGLAVII